MFLVQTSKAKLLPSEDPHVESRIDYYKVFYF